MQEFTIAFTIALIALFVIFILLIILYVKIEIAIALKVENEDHIYRIETLENELNLERIKNKKKPLNQ